jgi:hypothetical protein
LLPWAWSRPRCPLWRFSILLLQRRLVWILLLKCTPICSCQSDRTGFRSRILQFWQRNIRPTWWNLVWWGTSLICLKHTYQRWLQGLLYCCW